MCISVRRIFRTVVVQGPRSKKLPNLYEYEKEGSGWSRERRKNRMNWDWRRQCKVNDVEVVKTMHRTFDFTLSKVEINQMYILNELFCSLNDKQYIRSQDGSCALVGGLLQ